MQIHGLNGCRQFLAAFSIVAASAALAAAPATLYERLGGEKGVAQFVDDTITLTSTDPRTRRSFEKINLVNLKKKIAEHICELTEGPCKYTGDPMKLVHKGLDITEAEFYLMVEHLRIAVGRAGVAEGPKNELLRILAPMKRDIVTR